jgi:hypothetical protein
MLLQPHVDHVTTLRRPASSDNSAKVGGDLRAEEGARAPRQSSPGISVDPGFQSGFQLSCRLHPWVTGDSDSLDRAAGFAVFDLRPRPVSCPSVRDRLSALP